MSTENAPPDDDTRAAFAELPAQYVQKPSEIQTRI